MESVPKRLTPIPGLVRNLPAVLQQAQTSGSEEDSAGRDRVRFGPSGSARANQPKALTDDTNLSKGLAAAGGEAAGVRSEDGRLEVKPALNRIATSEGQLREIVLEAVEEAVREDSVPELVSAKEIAERPGVVPGVDAQRSTPGRACNQSYQRRRRG